MFRPRARGGTMNTSTGFSRGPHKVSNQDSSGAHMSEPLPIGTSAPDFTLPSHLGDFVTLSTFHGDRGKNIVLFFYPLDWTPV